MYNAAGFFFAAPTGGEKVSFNLFFRERGKNGERIFCFLTVEIGLRWSGVGLWI